MFRFASLILSLSLVGSAFGSLAITNGDFQTDVLSYNSPNVVDWHDSYDWNNDMPNNWAWWSGSWYGSADSPTGSSVLGLSSQTNSWAYQAIGTNSEGLSSIGVAMIIGSLTSSPGLGDIGVIVSLYQVSSDFVGSDGTDISGQAISSFTVIANQVEIGGTIAVSGILDLTGANTTDALYLKLANANGATPMLDVAVDNVNIVVPEPATMSLLGLGGLFLARKRS